ASAGNRHSMRSPGKIRATVSRYGAESVGGFTATRLARANGLPIDSHRGESAKCTTRRAARSRPFVAHPDELIALGVKAGDKLTISSDRGQIEAIVREHQGE